MLFSWLKRKSDAPPRPTPKSSVLPISTRDWSAFTDATEWPSIKIWLTPAQAGMLDGLADYRNQSRSEVMRDLLFIGLYGHFTYAQLVNERRGFLRDAARQTRHEAVLFNLRRKPPQATSMPPSPTSRAKKSQNVRLFLPPPMLRDLEALAASADCSLSAIARQVLVGMLDGQAPR